MKKYFKYYIGFGARGSEGMGFDHFRGPKCG
jgi:hypothetical protein